MNISINITAWLLSAMVSDLTQTANFTRQGMAEGNLVVKEIVEPRSPYGEIGLGIIGTGLVFNKDIPESMKVLWAVGHTWAVIHNRRNVEEKIPLIIFPVVKIEF